MAKMLERFQRILRGEEQGAGVPMIPPPIGELMGMQLVAVGEGTAEVTMEAGARHHNPMGALHGGVICDLADLAMGIALGTLFEEGEAFTTIELKTNFLRPILAGRLTARARVVHRGRTVSLVECDVTSADGKLVARTSSTLMAIEAPPRR
jgi:uncharacterized protein (TIGR00369 family)